MSKTQLTPQPDVLYLIRGEANPNGADDTELFLLSGDATAAPIARIVPADGVELPERRSMLASQPFRLKILHFNDLHNNVCEVTPEGHLPVFSRIVQRLRSVRERYRGNPNVAVLAMSAGDDLVGSIFDALMGDDPASYVAHASYRVASEAGIDIGLLGNHDLDLGLALLEQAIRKDTRFPLLAANLVGGTALAGLIYPAALFVTKGVRVGVVGLTTPAGRHMQAETDLRIAHPLRTALNILPALRPLCDIVIVLSHLGYSLAASEIVRDAGDFELAMGLPPDTAHLIVGGHTHHALNAQDLAVDNIVNGIPIVQAGNQGQFVGEVVVTLQPEASVTDARLVRTADLPDDPDFDRRQIAPLLELVRPIYKRRLGEVANDFDLSTESVRNCFASGESALANFITDALAAQCRARGLEVDVVVADTSTVSTGLPIGELTYGDLFHMMPYADTLHLRRMTGRQLTALIEDNALRVDRPIDPHTDRGFLHFSAAVRYVVELAAHRREGRATAITFAGRPIGELLEREFVVASGSFLRGMAAAWERSAGRILSVELFQIHRIPFVDSHLFVRDLVEYYIAEHGGVTPASGARRDGRVQIMHLHKEPNQHGHT
jgi:5'-nucleotidase / UDP-sugar diphosphatase